MLETIKIDFKVVIKRAEPQYFQTLFTPLNIRSTGADILGKQNAYSIKMEKSSKDLFYFSEFFSILEIFQCNITHFLHRISCVAKNRYKSVRWTRITDIDILTFRAKLMIKNSIKGAEIARAIGKAAYFGFKMDFVLH